MSKPFNLEAARRGEPVMTSRGHPARIVCFDMRWSDLDTRMVVLVECGDGERTYHVPDTGCSDDCRGPITLVMAPRKRKLYVNVYRSGSSDYSSAISYASTPQNEHHLVKTVEIEVDE